MCLQEAVLSNGSSDDKKKAKIDKKKEHKAKNKLNKQHRRQESADEAVWQLDVQQEW